MSEHEASDNLNGADQPRDRYEIVSVLGRGGTSTVYLARDRYIDRQVALKVLSADVSPKAVERIRAEAIIGQELQHPSIVRVYDLTLLEGGSTYAVVMEHVSGSPCRDRVASGWYSEPERVLETLRAVAAALAHAHRAGVIHRDVKPSNVLVADDGTVKLGDFGIASCEWLDTDLTRTAPAGTTDYMAPELFKGAAPGEKSDVYSLGVLARVLITAIDRSLLTPSRHRWLRSFVKRCTDLEPQDRFTATEAADYLNSPPPEGARDRLRAFTLALAILLTLLHTAAIVTLVVAERDLTVMSRVATLVMRFENATNIELLSLAYRLGLDLGRPIVLVSAACHDKNPEILDTLAERAMLPPDHPPGAELMLCMAVQLDCPMAVRRLLDSGVPLPTECHFNSKPQRFLSIAFRRSGPETRALLIEREAFKLKAPEDVSTMVGDAFTNLTGRDLVRVIDAIGVKNLPSDKQHTVVRGALGWHGRRFVRALALAGVDVNATDENGNTALHHASADCDRRAVWRLLGTPEVRVEIKNRFGQTPADVACRGGDARRAAAIRAELRHRAARRAVSL